MRIDLLVKLTLFVALVITRLEAVNGENRIESNNDPLPNGWIARSPRDEIRPSITYDKTGGKSADGAFIIAHDERMGLDGWIERSFEINGSEHYQLTALRRLTNVDVPRRCALVRILWKDDQGRMVTADVPEGQSKELGHTPTAEPDHPVDIASDGKGWTTVSGTYKAPSKATRAIVELHLQWAPKGKAEWSGIEFKKVDPIQPRKVKLATIHYKPTGKSPIENCIEFEPYLDQASKEKVDLVVLGETIPSVNTKLLPHEIAEPIPGPTSKYFAATAKKHNLHIVLSLYERDEHLVYNTAILVGPEGELIGKYRKVCLPHGEVEKGVAPGSDYPVFQTRFGKVGLMVCYDGFFPEVARELSNRGAEIIAWPVWGCNVRLATARACENHIYLVSSTFMQPKDGWMISAVFDQTGKPIATADTWGTLGVAEVDLSSPYIGPWNLGDFHSMIQRHRPIGIPEPAVQE